MGHMRVPLTISAEKDLLVMNGKPTDLNRQNDDLKRYLDHMRTQ